jgi:hypothetical protein
MGALRVKSIQHGFEAKLPISLGKVEVVPSDSIRVLRDFSHYTYLTVQRDAYNLIIHSAMKPSYGDRTVYVTMHKDGKIDCNFECGGNDWIMHARKKGEDKMKITLNNEEVQIRLRNLNGSAIFEIMGPKIPDTLVVEENPRALGTFSSYQKQKETLIQRAMSLVHLRRTGQETHSHLTLLE